MTHTIKYAYIETTNYCNLHCTFCNRDEVIGKLNHMPVFKFRQLLDKLGSEVKEAKLMGMGEPFLHPSFDVICKMFKDRYPDSFVISATNGQFSLNSKHVAAINHLDMLYVSIDGYEESYEKFRPPAKWPKLIKFLEDLKAADTGKCRIVVNYTVNPGNVEDIEKVNAMLTDYDLAELRLNLVQNWDEEKDIESSAGTFSEDQLQHLKEKWSHLIKGKSDWDFQDCFWVKEGFYSTVEGNVKICCMNTSAKSVGNIFTSSVDDIFSTKAFNDIKSGCSSGKPSDHCKSCSYKELAPLLKKVHI